MQYAIFSAQTRHIATGILVFNSRRWVIFWMVLSVVVSAFSTATHAAMHSQNLPSTETLQTHNTMLLSANDMGGHSQADTQSCCKVHCQSPAQTCHSVFLTAISSVLFDSPVVRERSFSLRAGQRAAFEDQPFRPPIFPSLFA